MLKLPPRDEYMGPTRKEFLKRAICYVIDHYYDSNDDVFFNGKLIDDNIPLDMTGSKIDITGQEQEMYRSIDAHINMISESIQHQDISFAEALLKLLGASGHPDPYIYNKACINRSTFNNIINNNCKVSKKIALALAAALHLSVFETEILLSKAGLSLSRSDKRDLIISYCFNHNVYNVMQINEILMFFDQELIGSR